MKYSKIISYAQTCIANSEKYKKANVGEYSEYTLAYLFSKSILNPHKDIEIKSVPANPNPILGNVNGGIGIKNFEKLCQLYINWVDNHNQAPSYLIFNNTVKIGIKTWTYACARVVNYYWEQKCYPNKVLLSYKTFYVTPKPKPEPPKPTIKKYGRSTEHGCDNRGQNNGYYCGPHMVQEIIRNLTGKIISQSTLASVIGTTSDGSDHDGINTAFAWFNNKYDYNLSVEWKNFSDVGWTGIKNILESSNKDCGLHELYRNTWGHYTNFDKVYENSVDVHNSLGDYCSSGCYCGYTENRSKSEARSYLNGISQKSVLVVTNES